MKMFSAVSVDIWFLLRTCARKLYTAHMYSVESVYRLFVCLFCLFLLNVRNSKYNDKVLCTERKPGVIKRSCAKKCTENFKWEEVL